MRMSIEDILAERYKQINAGWDEKNKGLNIDQYIGIAIAYIGRATCSYRNVPSEKREMLMKAAAVLAQAIDRIDDGSLDLAIPLGISQRETATAWDGRTGEGG